MPSLPPCGPEIGKRSRRTARRARRRAGEAARQRFGWAFPKPQAVFHRKAPHMGEAPLRRDFGHGCTRLGAAKRFPSLVKAHIAKIAHWRLAAAIIEMLEQRSP